jgi:hypothetical protein
MSRKYSGLPDGIKLSNDLKEFREFALLEFLSPSEFEKVFSAFCKHKTSTQAEKLKSIAERI